MAEATGEFNINELIDKPLNELTEDEAAFVVEWQAGKRFEAYRHSQACEELREQIQGVADVYKTNADTIKETLDELRQRALAFYSEQ